PSFDCWSSSIPRPQLFSLFPYTTLFRSKRLPVVRVPSQPARGLNLPPGVGVVFELGSSNEVEFVAVERDFVLDEDVEQAEAPDRSEEHTSEPSHQIISYAVFCLKQKNHA